jgi:hypothetical protein
MEKAKKSGSKKTKSLSEESLIMAYQEYLLLNGKKPTTVYKFCKDLGIQENDFYKVAGSFEALEKHIWAGYIRETLTILESDSSFEGFSAREKLLSFYFTLMEKLKANRSFAMLLLNRHERMTVMPNFLKTFKQHFEEIITRILSDGKATGEVAERPYLDKRYPQLLWVHMTLLLNYWKEDDSAEFENTDAFIEKSVNLAFNLIGKGAVDSAIDFAKFLYQSKTR